MKALILLTFLVLGVVGTASAAPYDYYAHSGGGSARACAHGK